MIRRSALRVLTAVCLALWLLLPAAVLAESASSGADPGVSWDLTVDQMMEAEGVTDLSAVDTYAVGDFTQYGFPHEADAENPPTYVYYIFQNGRLVMLGHNADTSEMGDGADVATVFDSMLATMSETFGEPTIEDAQRFVDQLNAMEEGTAEAGDISLFAGWDLGSGTELYLMGPPDGGSILYVYTLPALVLGE
jgi:hypothetical protein